MNAFEQVAVPLLSFLFFSLALYLIVDATRQKPRDQFFRKAGGPWVWIGAFTICGAMGAAKALGGLGA